MRILVTGGAGFIGSHFVEYVLNTTEYEVTTIDTLTYSGDRENLQRANQDDRHKFIEGDIRNENLVEKLLETADVVVNFAAETHVDRSITDSSKFVSTNIEGARVLLAKAVTADIDTFLQISTDEVYGEVLKGTASEKDPLSPRNPYAATKAGADHLARSYYVTHNLPVVITRSSNNFGPRQHPEKVIPKFIEKATNGEQLTIYGDGSNIREWIYVKDNCSAILTALEKGTPGEIYNIGSGDKLTNVEMAKAIISELGIAKDHLTFVEDRPGHDQRYALDTEKMRSLGWETNWTFTEGLRKTINFYR
jgi:dTDP-glucose 4,6-dehydratase